MTLPSFAAGIIAAGDGSRLKDAFPGTVKPMVPVAGRPLCAWIAAGLSAAGATSVTMISNTRCGPARRHLQTAFPGVAWHFIVEDTGSSWESFRLVAGALSGERDFVVSTADALVPPEKTALFVSEMRRLGAACGLALTDFIDDEKPLWAELGPDGTVRALGPDCKVKELATSGLYYMTGPRARSLAEASAHASLRDFLTAETSLGAVRGADLGKTVDVDRPEDVGPAEEFIKEHLLARGGRRAP
ncbi:MAG: NTP transferase domain-containing protein [Elusimicrobia bacterium]|nr:NTP transferase domain-containing protein [Elusimicrobiota bacterium]